MKNISSKKLNCESGLGRYDDVKRAFVEHKKYC